MTELSAENLVSQVNEGMSEQEMRDWVTAVLGLTQAADGERLTQFDYPAYQLTALDLALYRLLVQNFGKEGIMKETRNDPNVTRLFIWGMNEKYGLGLRWRTEVTGDGIFRYALGD